MIEYLDQADDVLALTISHKIDGDELNGVLDRLEEKMRDHDKVHLFVESHAIDGISLSGLGHYAGRAMPLLGKLAHFGRVAVVSDQAWMRWGTRFESAVLPFISYRVFTPDQRDEALAWVARGSQEG